MRSALREWKTGSASGQERVVSALYGEMRRLAGRLFRRERRGHTLQPTALVHEAFVHLVRQHSVDWQGRTQFMALAAQAMRRVLVDHARERLAQKRGGTWVRVELDEAAASAEPRAIDVLNVDAALAELQTLDARQASVVELRFFAGLSVEESAEALGISEATVKREWRLARAWLHGRLASKDS